MAGCAPLCGLRAEQRSGDVPPQPQGRCEDASTAPMNGHIRAHARRGQDEERAVAGPPVFVQVTALRIAVAKDNLTDKQQLFAIEYAASLNGTEAAALAGYQGDRNTLGVIAYENLRKPKIRAEIDRILKERTFTAEEILSRLSDQARGVPKECFRISHTKMGINFEALEEHGLLHLIKKLSYDKDGRPIVELYDAQAALVHLGKHHGLFVERSETSGPNGGPVETKVTFDFSGLDTDQLLALVNALAE